jgi:hypothetical protein
MGLLEIIGLFGILSSLVFANQRFVAGTVVGDVWGGEGRGRGRGAENRTMICSVS